MQVTATRTPGPTGEAELQRVWAEDPLPQPLRCLDGELLRVIFRGRANSGAGPDFRNAIFLNGKQRPVRGDVEMHCRLADWWAHGHESDPAYRAVTLHIVAAGGGGNTRPRRGRIAELRVTESEPGLRGDTASGVTKLATLETGAVVQVPLFVGPGELIRVDTRTGNYLERVRE